MKRTYIGIFGVLVILSMIASAGAVESYTTDSNLMKEYGVNIGDVLEYDVHLNFDVNVSDPSVYTALDQYYAAQGESVDSQEMFSALSSVFDIDFQIQFTVSQFNHSKWSYDWGYTRENDEIFATLKIRDDENDNWQDPYQWLITTNAFSEAMSYYSTLVPMQMPTSVQVPPVAIGGWDKWTDNNDPNNTGEGLYGGPFVLPLDVDIEAAWNLAKAEYAKSVQNCTDCPTQTDLDSFLSDAGISVYTEPHGLAVSFRVENINWNAVDDNGSAIVSSMLAESGIVSYSGGVAIGVEYTEQMVLNTFAAYIDGAVTLDLPPNETHYEYVGYGYGDYEYNYTTGEYDYVGDGNGAYSLVVTDLPDIHNQGFSVYAEYTVSQFGATPPSKEDIQSGNIAESRSGSGLGAIPGYPMAIVSLISVITVGYIIYRKRK